ncbi:MAG: hypothetical protein DMD81_15745 [Candidatus Rokuibacteriota bacterium]|nr:MAG: hypothetical protein DMD81_15745 [Candidatus Rokubacteria bacterium]
MGDARRAALVVRRPVHGRDAMRIAGAALAMAAALLVIAPATGPAQTLSPERVHRIQSGDTLSGIARRYSVSVNSLMSANGLRAASARLRLGSQLTIPEPRLRAAVVRSSTARPAIERAPHAAPPRSVRRAALVATPPANLSLAVPQFVDDAPAFAWPIEGALSSAFGRRRNGWHRGIDIVAPPGAPVLAAASGLVDDGFVTVYAHNDQNLVELGDWVATGQRIATVGRTGRATSEHLHFEIRREGRAYNPLYLLPLPPRLAEPHGPDAGEANDDE